MWAPIAAKAGAWHGVVLLASLHEKRFVYQPKTRWKNKVTVKPTTAKRRRITFWAAHWTHLWHAHHIRHVCVCVSVCGSVCKGLAHPGSEDQQQIVNRKYKNCENGALLFSLSFSSFSLPLYVSWLLPDDFVDAGDRKLCKLFSNNIKIKQERTQQQQIWCTRKKRNMQNDFFAALAAAWQVKARIFNVKRGKQHNCKWMLKSERGEGDRGNVAHCKLAGGHAATPQWLFRQLN